MVGIAITTIWWTIGFNFVLYLAGLQDIPRELYEAAAVDGATPWQQIRCITIPMLSRTTTLVVLLQIIASLKIFDQVYLMTAGGPGTSTQVRAGSGHQHRVHRLPGRRRLGRVGAAVHRDLAGHGDPPADRTRPGRRTAELMASRRLEPAAAPPRTTGFDAAPPRNPNAESVVRPARSRSPPGWCCCVFSVLWLVPSLWAIKTSLTPNEVSALGAGPILKDWNLTLASYATILPRRRHLELVPGQRHHLGRHRDLDRDVRLDGRVRDQPAPVPRPSAGLRA